MKFYETHFEDYCKSWDKLHENDMEQSIKTIEFPNKTPQDLIVYGSSGVGKYTHVLSMLRPYSPSQLKHDKKIKASTDKQSYTYRISDIHYEVDMSLLGCNSKIIWHEIYSQIVDIVTIKPEKMGFIVCKNFHAIHIELLEIFYSYMQQYCYGYEGKSREVQIYFILITEHVSFLPNTLLNHCHIVRVPRPSRQVISSFAQINKSKEGVDAIFDTIDTENIINMKEIYSFSLIASPDKIPNDHFNMVCDTLIQEMLLIIRPKSATNLPENDEVVESDIDTDHMVRFRDCLYDILIYNLDGLECIWYIFQYFIRNEILQDHPRIVHLLYKLSTIFKQFGNNYRSIFHLENAIFSMMI